MPHSIMELRHQEAGTVSSKRRRKSVGYWMGWTVDPFRRINRCHKCQSQGNKSIPARRTKAISTDIASLPTHAEYTVRPLRCSVVLLLLSFYMLKIPSSPYQRTDHVLLSFLQQPNHCSLTECSALSTGTPLTNRGTRPSNTAGIILQALQYQMFRKCWLGPSRCRQSSSHPQCSYRYWMPRLQNRPSQRSHEPPMRQVDEIRLLVKA